MAKLSRYIKQVVGDDPDVLMSQQATTEAIQAIQAILENPVSDPTKENVGVAAGLVEAETSRAELAELWEEATTTSKSIKYGRLYNWYAATDPRGIAPEGYHLPSEAELQVLISNPATNLFSTSKGGTNSTGFNITGGGYRDNLGVFSGLTAYAIYWGIESGIDSGVPQGWSIACYPHTYIASGFSGSVNGLSIRYIKDDSVNEEIVTDIDGNIYHTVTIGTQVWTASNVATLHYRNGDPIGSDFSGTVGAVCSYNNDESNVYDIVTIVDPTYVQPKNSKRIKASIIDDLPVTDLSDYVNYETFIPVQIGLQEESGREELFEIAISATVQNEVNRAEGVEGTKVDKVTGESLVPNTEIVKIHIQNTDNTLLSPDGSKSVNLDNSGTLHVENISQQGTPYETHAEQLLTTKDEIILRDGATSGLANGTTTGLRAKLYDGSHDGILEVDNNGVTRVGDDGDTQPLATREEMPINGGLAYWDALSLKFKTLATSVKNSYDNAVTNSHTHSNKSALDLVLGTNTGNETESSVGTLVNSLTEKTTPVAADLFTFRDSVSGLWRKITQANYLIWLTTLFMSKTTQTTVSLLVANWSSTVNGNGFYYYTVTDANVLTTSWIDAVFSNANMAIVLASGIQPFITVSAGSFIIEAISIPTTALSFTYKILGGI